MMVLTEREKTDVDTLRTGYPRVQALSQDKGQAYPEAPVPTSWLGAACRLSSRTHLLAQGSSRAATCPKDRLCRLQAIK
jgi:hypothetical protein